MATPDWSPDDDGIPPELRYFVRQLRQLDSPEEQAKRRRLREELLRAGDLAYETYGGFDLQVACVKCGYGEEAARCVYLPEGLVPQATGHHDVIARTCRRCMHTWMQRTREDQDAAPRAMLLPVHQLAEVVAEVYLDVYRTVTPEEFAPMTPAELADAVRKKLVAAGHAVPADT